jgi:hypothetical protein
MDVMKYEDPKRMAETACSFGDGIDMPVDNATKDPGGTLVDLDPGLCRKIIETDLTGPFLLMNAAIPHVIASRGGPIINIASFGGPLVFRACRHIPPRKRAWFSANSERRSAPAWKTSSRSPRRAYPSPARSLEEVTGICSYLVSDDSAFMTGSPHLIDCGYAVVNVSGTALTNAAVKWGA